MSNLYFDYAATTPLATEAFDAMRPYFSEVFANPSALYSAGQKAHVALGQARKIYAQISGCTQEEIFFTGGATEGIHTVLRGMAHSLRERGNHLITTSFEHSAVLHAMEQLEREGYEVTYVSPDKDGHISLESIQKAVTEQTIIVSCMYVNNEVGSIQPIAELGAFLQKKNIFFHTDAAQAFPYLSCDLHSIHADAITFAPHKYYGPKGVGVVALRKNWQIEPLIPGNQEFGLRGGTQHVANAVGAGVAAEVALSQAQERMTKLSDLHAYARAQIERFIPDVTFHTSHENTLPTILNVGFFGISNDTLLIRLDMDGIAIAKGAACSSERSEFSHVLRAMGIPEEEAIGSIRLSFSHTHERKDIDHLIQRLAFHVGQIRHMNITY